MAPAARVWHVPEDMSEESEGPAAGRSRSQGLQGRVDDARTSSLQNRPESTTAAPAGRRIGPSSSAWRRAGAERVRQT